MKKDVLINLRVESELKERFQEIAESNGYTMSELLTASMKEVVRRGSIPINLHGKLPHKDRSILTIQQIKIAFSNMILQKEYKDSIEEVSIFGSYATGEMTPKSDIDFLIKTNKNFSLFDLSNLKSSLEESLHKSVDITIDGALEPYFSSIVNREKISIYEKQK